MSKSFAEVPEQYHKTPAGKLWARLNPKERWACDLLCTGRRNKQIAQELKTTEQAVKNLFRVVYDKIGADSRFELALWLLAERRETQSEDKNSDRTRVGTVQGC